MTIKRRVLQKFAQAVTPPKTQQRTRHKGVVATESPLTIYIDGGQVAVPAHFLAGYTPNEGDIVYVDNQGGDLVVHDAYGG